MRASVQRLRDAAVQEGIYAAGAAAYPNYAISNTSAEELYGGVNAERLRAVRGAVDPGGVMGLAGGFEV